MFDLPSNNFCKFFGKMFESFLIMLKYYSFLIFGRVLLIWDVFCMFWKNFFDFLFLARVHKLCAHPKKHRAHPAACSNFAHTQSKFPLKFLFLLPPPPLSEVFIRAPPPFHLFSRKLFSATDRQTNRQTYIYLPNNSGKL